MAQFIMESVKAKKDVLNTLVSKLTTKKTEPLTKADIHDKLMPDGGTVNPYLTSCLAFCFADVSQ